MQSATMCLRRSHQITFVAQQVVQARGQIISHFQRGNQNLFPGFTDNTAAVGHADHQRLGTGLFRLGQCHIGHAQISLAAIHPVLTYGVFGAPISDAYRNFGRQLVGRIAQKQQVRCLDHCGSLL